MSQQISRLLNFETFGLADVQRLEEWGYKESDLLGPSGLYGEEVTRVNDQSCDQHFIRSL